MFDGLRGNNETKALLRRVVRERRIPQSLIFSGRDGIGKKQFALEIARSFVCVKSSNGLPCHECAACIRAGIFKLPTSGKKEDYEKVYFSQHPDIGLVVPNKNTIYVDAIRDLAVEANYRPYEGRARVFVIDEAEKMGLSQKNAANALLKTLEEPAEKTHIILVTSKPASILQTIHSRCQTVRFSPIDRAEIEEYLTGTEGVLPTDARLLSIAAKGSLSKALDIDIEQYKTLRGRLLEVIAAASGRTNLAGALKVSEELAGAKLAVSYAENLELLQLLVRDILLVSSGLNESLVHSDIKNELKALSQGIPEGALSRWISEIESLKASLRFNINKKVGTDALFVGMAGA